MVAVMALMSVCANAQVWVAGGVNLNVTTPKGGDANTTFSFAPEVGYKLNENWDIAIAFDEEYVKDNNRLTIAPYARYTFAKLGALNLFVDGGFGFKTVQNGSNTFNIGVAPGLAYNFNDNWCIVTRLGKIGWQTIENGSSQFNIGVNGACSFGVAYTF